MKLYWWPYLYDAYFDSIEFIAVADSISHAIFLVEEKIDNLNYQEKEKIELKNLINTNEPIVHSLENPLADYAETNR